MPVYQLDDEIWFPDPYEGEENGLIAVGGDLSPQRLLLAYQHGIFPWYNFHFPTPMWYCPLDRFVIFPKEIHISHSMRQLLRQDKYLVTFNHDFEGVIHGCATVDGRDQIEGSWIGPNIIKAYTDLHHLGYVTSVEVWERQEDHDGTEGAKLVGGLYGVTIGKAFFGESMFSLVPNASKLALIHLAWFMAEKGGSLIDCQFETPHLKSMGGRHITYEEYMEILTSSVHYF